MAETSSHLTKAFNSLSIQLESLEPGPARDQALKKKEEIAKVIEDLDDAMLAHGKAAADEFQSSKTKEGA